MRKFGRTYDRRKPRRVWEVEDKNRRKYRKKGKASAKKQGEVGETLKRHTGDEAKGYEGQRVLHGPVDFAKTLKLRFRVGDLDLPGRGKRHTGSREEEVSRCADVPVWQGYRGYRTHIVGECEVHKEERDVLSIEEMREKDECDTEEFDTLDSSEKTIAILGDRWWPQAAKQEGDKSRKNIYM